MSTLPQDPQSFRKAFAYRRRRAFFSFRRRSDVAWFIINICLFVFSITVLVYKVKFEPPTVIEKVIERKEIQQVPVPTATWPAEPAAPMPEGGTIQPSGTKPIVDAAPAKPAADAPAPAKAAEKAEKKEPPRPAEPKKPKTPPLVYKVPSGKPWDFLTQKNWKISAHKNGVVALAEADTDAGRSQRISYDFFRGDWVSIYQDVQFDLSGFKKIDVSYFLADGAPAAMEFRLEDDAGVVYSYPLDRSLDGQWHGKEISVNMRIKGAKPFDWKKVRRVHVYISGKEGEKAPGDRKGTLWLSELKAS